jgi:hypothetical protein
MTAPLDPLVVEQPPAVPLAPRISDLRGKRLGLVDNSKVNADLFLAHLSDTLVDRFGVIIHRKVRKLAPKDHLDETEIGSLVECDAVVQCFGDCGTSTSISVADAVELERRGVPTVTVFSTAFANAARNQAVGRGIGNLQLVRIPHPMHTAPKDVVIERADAAVAGVVARLTREAPVESEDATTASVLAGVADDDQEHFFARGWTDGLPIVAPSAEKVARMVAASGRSASDTVGPIPPRWRVATIEKIAVNAVMAGCRPEYVPVVLAALEAMLDPDFQLFGIQTATNTTTPLIIVNGPIAEKLDINSRGNLFGQGWRANATIGRAVQLILRNIGGDIPGKTDMSTHGQPGKFSFCMAEAEQDSPWAPYHVEAGFSAADSTVTVIGASAPQNIFTYGCETGEDILQHIIGSMTALGHNNIIFPTGPLLILSPEHASTLARDGIGKKDIRQAVYERARIPLTRFVKRSVEGLRHRRARWFAEAGDADHIGVADRPDDVRIFVAGGAGIHSLFVPTAFSYRAVTRKIAPEA